jgi:hypothetical protein
MNKKVFIYLILLTIFSNIIEITMRQCYYGTDDGELTEETCGGECVVSNTIILTLRRSAFKILFIFYWNHIEN